MSDDRDNQHSAAANISPVSAAKEAAPTTAQAATPAVSDSLDAVEDIDFLLEEIENKIAPLALA